MAAPLDDQHCSPLAPLRAVADSLRCAAAGESPTAPERRKLARAVRDAGHAALPMLLRSFGSRLERESSLAYYLLGRLGGERVVQRLHRLVLDAHVDDDVKARALGLLSDLRAPVPAGTTLRDPEALLQRSVRDLLATLDHPREMAQAVTLIIEQVPEEELPAFASELLRHGGARATPLIDALLHRRGLSQSTIELLVGLKRRALASPAEQAAAEALERGLEYLEAGKPKAARRRLQRFIRNHPNHAEGRSALGVCLIHLNDFDGAIVHLREAARIEPDEALHRWNVAAACKQADRLGGAYLGLRDYLKLDDDTDGARDRRSEARSFVRAYEKMLRDSHPGVPLDDYLRGEELFARAYAALSEGRPDDALRGFEEVLALVPRHYPSWGNLGAAYLALERKEEAQRCLRRALELNPEYAVARKNLQLLDSQA
jgi:tetratricopeptide (TPR) repeat protein